MAEWLKMDKDLQNKPEVRRLARLLGLSRFDIIGRLHTVWAWADTHSLTGNDMDITEADIDDIADLGGFAVALRQVGWLQGRDAALQFPNFDRHNGQTAKARALDSLRKKIKRDVRHAPCVTQTGQEPDKCPVSFGTQTGLEKKRKEENNKKENTVATTGSPPDAAGGRKSLKSGVSWTSASGFEGITDVDRQRWCEAYPAVTLELQLKRMDLWLRDNPSKAKKANWHRFVTNWLSRSQERGGDVASSKEGGVHERKKTFAELADAG